MVAYRSFVTVANGLANRLINDANIGRAFNPEENLDDLPVQQYRALWDTGATNTVVTEKVIVNGSLQPIGITKVLTASGETNSYTYFVSLWLPHKVCFPNLKVTRGELGQDIDILIGMDVINRGDFSVTNLDDITTFSFRIPSLERVDYTGQLKPDNPCVCGSGKLFKDCHGMAKK